MLEVRQASERAKRLWAKVAALTIKAESCTEKVLGLLTSMAQSNPKVVQAEKEEMAAVKAEAGPATGGGEMETDGAAAEGEAAAAMDTDA